MHTLANTIVTTYGRLRQNDTWDKMIQRDFSNDDAMYDVPYLTDVLKSAIL